MARVQINQATINSQPNMVDSIVNLDFNALQKAGIAPAAIAQTTLEQAVQLAYKMYIEVGFESNAALASVNVILPQLTANPAGYAAIVNADIVALSAAKAASAIPIK